MAGQSGPALIALEGISRIYGAGATRVAALEGLTLRIARGEFVAIMGPSGSGKSTLMHILGCLDTPSSGSYRFLGAEVARLSRHQRALLRRHFIGFVFQGFNLLARASALENVELPLIYQGLSRPRRHALARGALARVGLSGREGHRPGALSGGQQQRVAIARALVTRPALILADEPTGNLDSARGAEIMALLAELNATDGTTIVMVTHEAEMAGFARRHVLFHDGRLARDGAAPGRLMGPPAPRHAS